MFHIIALGTTILLCFSLAAWCQTPKIGYVNTSLIIQQMPEYEGARQKLQQLSDEWKATLAKMKTEIKRLQEEFDARKLLYTKEIRDKKKQLIQQKVNAREQFLKQKFGPEGDYFRKGSSQKSHGLYN